MTDVLHLQTRAYPLHFTFPGAYGPDTPASVISVPGRGKLAVAPGTLSTLAYNLQTTAEVDLTEVITAGVTLRGAVIAGCRARILPVGAVLVTYALRHDRDLSTMSPGELVTVDAEINNNLREADRPILLDVLAEVVKTFKITKSATIGDAALANGPMLPLDRRTTRYTCHFLAREAAWMPEKGSGVHDEWGILLPFTYAWRGDPAQPLEEILPMLEPTDIAVAQRSILAGATLEGRKILARLASGQTGQVENNDFRLFLDGVWSDYYDLDSYRIESAQAPRVIFLAASKDMDMDQALDQAQMLLGHVSASLLAASSARSEVLDTRLNRVAASLTLVIAAGFVFSLVQFLAPVEPIGTRTVIVIAVVVLALGSLAYTINPARVRKELHRAFRLRRIRRRRSADQVVDGSMGDPSANALRSLHPRPAPDDHSAADLNAGS